MQIGQITETKRIHQNLIYRQLFPAGLRVLANKLRGRHRLFAVFFVVFVGHEVCECSMERFRVPRPSAGLEHISLVVLAELGNKLYVVLTTGFAFDAVERIEVCLRR